MNKVFGITGWKNSGKTTLVACLVEEFTSRGFVVSTIKHASESFQLDLPGTDTFAHREAGAHEVAIISDKRWAIMHQTLASNDAPSLDTMIAKLAPCDLVLVEGFKASSISKIETIRADAVTERAVWRQNKSVVAVASDTTIKDCQLPTFALDDISSIANHIAQKTGLVS